jgi:hypothetical protein
VTSTTPLPGPKSENENSTGGAWVSPCVGTVCGSVCVDTSSDARNCGACGAVCDGTCHDRQCLHLTAPKTLASGQMYPSAIAVDATHVYWTNEGILLSRIADGIVMKVPIGGGATTVLAIVQNGPVAIQIGRAHV